jgi:hypothetical protein
MTICTICTICSIKYNRNSKVREMEIIEPLELIKAQKERVDKMNGKGVELGPEAEPLDLLYAVFRNPDLPLQMRMTAAKEAAQYVHPKISAVVSANVTGEDFGEALERARKRMLEGPKPSEGPAHEPKALPKPGRPSAAWRMKGLLEP